MAKPRTDLSQLAGVPVHAAKVPEFARSAPARAVLTEQIAFNPLNTRTLTDADAQEMAASLEGMGQMTAAVAVTRAAFLHVFPEYEEQIGTKQYVQIAGARRLSGAIYAKRRTLDVQVKDAYAVDRLTFLAATAIENLDRKDLNPMDEAVMIQQMVAEAGNQKDVAEKLRRTPPWVHQRLTLLKLTEDLQQLVREGVMQVTVAREIGKLPHDEQGAAWDAAQASPAPEPGGPEPGAGDTEGGSPAPARQTAAVKANPYAAAVKRLGGTGDKIAEALLTTMDDGELRVLAAKLNERLAGA